MSGELTQVPNDVLTVAEVAAYLKLSQSTVWRQCVHGTLPAFRVGRQWRIERRDLELWIGAMKAQSPLGSGLKE
jgi:excisionase family DNA binding protein